MEKRITLKDVAEKLGVSQNTVSVALRGGSGVSQELREQIITVAGDMATPPGGSQPKRPSSYAPLRKTSGTPISFRISTAYSVQKSRLGAGIPSRSIWTPHCRQGRSTRSSTKTISVQSPSGLDSDKQLVTHFAGTKIPVTAAAFFIRMCRRMCN